ncbi:MAG: NUDIX hydrolase [Eubacteriales bacterium]|nr:NUDIX hydrolase [Eubacteriales bacterium]MDD3880652.1 NUDIX hydrolase [Eubacteriales bacterium]MDD4513557.1 NUDIX hydrolase [Eubacteriales bacterium]
MALYEDVAAFCPVCEQEEADKRVLLRLLASGEDIYTRDNKVCHLSASSWTVNHSRDKVLMVWHNIFRSWSWMGGHADGERDLLSVALRETREESGIRTLAPVSKSIFSLEILTVDGHEKRGEYVPSHLHLNVTYLLEADENEQIRSKPDENSGVRWFPVDEALAAVSEEWMAQRVYRKLCLRSR